MGKRRNFSNLKLASDSSSENTGRKGKMILNRPEPTGSSRGSLSKVVYYGDYSTSIERKSSQDFKTDRLTAVCQTNQPVKSQKTLFWQNSWGESSFLSNLRPAITEHYLDRGCGWCRTCTYDL